MAREMTAKIDLTYLDQILTEYKNIKGGLIPVLQKVQNHYAYIPEETVDVISEALNIPSSEIYGVITFYTQFYTKPRGIFTIKICRGTACHVRGSKSVLEAIERYLGMKEGSTSDDFKFTIDTVACLGACALAPVIMINNTYYGKMTAQKVEEILKQLENE